MDKFFVRKDVYEDLIEKGYGKRDLSKLTKKQITDKNGHKRTVYVRNGEQPAVQNQPKAQEELSPEKKAHYEEMLEKVKTGSDENALFVRSKGMLNKKDAIAYLEGKLGKKSSSSLREQIPSIREKEESLTVNEADKFYGNYGLKKVGESVDRKGWTVKEYKNNAGETWIGKFNKEGKYVGSEYNPVGAKKNSSAEGHLESDYPQNTDITKEDEERFGKQALSGLSGKRTSSEEKNKPSQDDIKENYLDARNEGGRDIADENRVANHSDKAFNLNDKDKKALNDFFEKLQNDPTYKSHYVIGNYLSKENKELNSKLHKMEDEYKEKHPEAEGNTFSYDLSEKFIKDAFEDFKKKNVSKTSFFDEEFDDTNKVSFEDSVKEYNFTDTKKNQFAMDEVANFYPELKDVVDKRRQAFREVSDAENKLKINPNNKEYKDNFANAYNKLKQADAEYDKDSKKALEKAPKIKKPDFNKYMDAKRDVQKFLDKYKQQSEEYEVGQRLRENGASFLSPMYGLKPDDYTKDPNYIKAQMTIRAYEDK